MPASLCDLKKLPLTLSPQDVAAQLGHYKTLCFLDSSGHFPQNYHRPLSLIAADPDEIISGDHTSLGQLKTHLSHYQSPTSELPTGGAIGWFNYDGTYCFGLFSSLLVYDHQGQQWWSNGDLQNHLKPPAKAPKASIQEFHSNFSKKDYIQRVLKIQDYIRSGDIYQANLTQRFEANIEGPNLFPLYQQLRHSSPAPMAAYLRLNGREVLSSSPETFLKINHRIIETRPIKGTSPRFSDPQQDKLSAATLLKSEKERAELVMITDLLRNDLGQLCKYGSIHVPEMIQLESLEHVYHLVSKVTGELSPDYSHLEALSACLPGGSVTGAPKIRSMEVIEELETVPRGLYTGAIGYLGFNQQTQFNIAIRTLIRENEKLSYHVGAGIVADSDPESEYAETLQKAKGIRHALSQYLAY